MEDTEDTDTDTVDTDTDIVVAVDMVSLKCYRNVEEEKKITK